MGRKHIHLIGPTRSGPKVPDEIRCVSCGLSTNNKSYIKCDSPASQDGGRLCHTCQDKVGVNTPNSCLMWVDIIGTTKACDLCLKLLDSVMQCIICTRQACLSCIAIESLEYFVKSGVDSILCIDCFPASARRSNLYNESPTERTTTPVEHETIDENCRPEEQCLPTTREQGSIQIPMGFGIDPCNTTIYTSSTNRTQYDSVSANNLKSVEQKGCLAAIYKMPNNSSKDWCCMCLEAHKALLSQDCGACKSPPEEPLLVRLLSNGLYVDDIGGNGIVRDTEVVNTPEFSSKPENEPYISNQKGNLPQVNRTMTAPIAVANSAEANLDCSVAKSINATLLQLSQAQLANAASIEHIQSKLDRVMSILDSPDSIVGERPLSKFTQWSDADSKKAASVFNKHTPISKSDFMDFTGCIEASILKGFENLKLSQKSKPVPKGNLASSEPHKAFQSGGKKGFKSNNGKGAFYGGLKKRN